MLNDEQFVEAARAFAQRVLERNATDERRLQWAFAEATSRLPRAEELSVLSQALARERARFAGDARAAQELVSHGESSRDAAFPPAEHAAWTQVAAVLLNLSEAVTRN